jgi:hypothetical protein
LIVARVCIFRAVYPEPKASLVHVGLGSLIVTLNQENSNQEQMRYLELPHYHATNDYKSDTMYQLHPQSISTARGGGL